MDLVLSSAPEPLTGELRDHYPSPGLAAGWHTHRTDLHRAAKALQIGLTLKLQPWKTEWNLQPEHNQVDCLLTQKY